MKQKVVGTGRDGHHVQDKHTSSAELLRKDDKSLTAINPSRDDVITDVFKEEPSSLDVEGLSRTSLLLSSSPRLLPGVSHPLPSDHHLPGDPHPLLEGPSHPLLGDPPHPPVDPPHPSGDPPHPLPGDPPRTCSRFSDTSLQIHLQWMQSRKQRHLPAAVAAVCTSPMDASKQLWLPVGGEEGKRQREVVETTAVQDESSKLANCLADHENSSICEDVGDKKVMSMELAYVTESIIALWFPANEVNETNEEEMLAEAISMLKIKHAGNCMIFDLSIPKEADLHSRACSFGMTLHYLGWQGRSLAPPLERLCSACKFIESWLSTNPQHVAVLFSRGTCSKERIGVVISAYLTYSGICGSKEQALDRYAMRRFLQDKIGSLKNPSNVRYVGHFSGLLSGGIRMNAEPLFLKCIMLYGVPSFETIERENSTSSWKITNENSFQTDIFAFSQGNLDIYDRHWTVCFFLKIYQQGLTLVYTSPVYELSESSESLTITLENSWKNEFSVHLRGDLLIKGYYLCKGQLCGGCSGNSLHRHALFQCQFHSCAVAKQSLIFSTAELDEVEDKKGCIKYPPDNGSLELHFSGAREAWTYPIPSTPLAFPGGFSPGKRSAADVSLSSTLYLPYADEEEEQFTLGSIVSWDSMADLRSGGTRGEEGAVVEATGWPSGAFVAESYGAVAEGGVVRVCHLSGPLDGSLYATVTKQHFLTEERHRVEMDCGGVSGVDARSPLPAYDVRSESCRVEAPPSSASPPLHARLDELLGDMLMTVENIPDLGSSSPPERDGESRGEGQARAEGGEEDIPYHARKDGRPFTYGAVPLRHQQRRRKVERHHREEHEEDEMHSELSSPGLVRKATSEVSPEEERRFQRDGYSPVDGYASITWLQQQQQKLRDRQEGKTRQERCPQEFRLLRELRTYQRCSSASSTLPERSRWPGKEDGYASDTSLPAGLGEMESNGYVEDEDSWDGRRWRCVEKGGDAVEEQGRMGRRHRAGAGENFTLPLRINTADSGRVKGVVMSSEPGSPPLPQRSVSKDTTMRYANSGHMTKSREENTLRTIGTGVTVHSLCGRNEFQMEGERPFVAVKRAHELAATGQWSKDCSGSLDEGLTACASQSRDDSFSSWATASMTWGEEEEDYVDEETGNEADEGDGKRGKIRPQTPAFPVHPRTPYSNGSSIPVGSIDHQQNNVIMEVNFHGNTGLPPKSPTAVRKDHSHMSVSTELHHQGSQGLQQQLLPDVANGGAATVPRQGIPMTSPHSNTMPLSGSQRSTFGEHQEVSPAHVKFVRDTSRFWYKPTISREEAIAILKDKEPGTFVVRDSNSFPGAFGLALKVATLPANMPNRALSSPTANGDMANELVRHFLIEPTSRGVKLKGCVNEPVFSSLSALVYQHSLTAMALPCRLILPESEPTAIRTLGSTDNTVSSNQILLQQGAACNVLYLISVETESLTGPQAIRRAVGDLFSKHPLPAPTVVHFKVSGQGITLTDNKRKLFFRRHYPVSSISHCSLDPDDRKWTEKNEDFRNAISSNRCFGFVARKPSSKGDNQCHVFAELDPEQPATAIVNFVTRVMMVGTTGKTSNIV